MIYILSFIVVLGVTITVHEFGHFAMAKLLKIRVLVFSLGFGPRLAGFTRGGTEYRLSPFPIGGYVKMAGEAFDEDRKGAPDEFLSHPKWHRFLVAISGPLMNILLAVFILAFFYIQGVPLPSYQKEPAIVGPVSANSIAKRAGLETGDLIVTVLNNPVKTWEDAEIALLTAPKHALNVEVLRKDRILRLHFDPPSTEHVMPVALGFRPSLPRTVVSSIDPKKPAGKAGLKEGDEILSIERNGKIVSDYSGIMNMISESGGVPISLTVRRPKIEPKRDEIWDAAKSPNSQIFHFTITPADEDGRGVLGFYPYHPLDIEKFRLVGAIGRSIRKNYESMILTFKILGRILKGTASVRTLSGPIEIARFSGSVAQTGSISAFIEFLAMVSLQLGVFNLLPIPILDGGVITLLIIEGLLGRDLSLGVKEKIVQVGFVFLILLMGFVVFNDLSKIIDFNRFFR